MVSKDTLEKLERKELSLVQTSVLLMSPYPLTEYDVRALSKELAHKPKFERFDIEEEFAPLLDPSH
ncbi:hypothetical protein Cantr_07322 [Candida viswanathii]|uniref:Uncharacterized protein n=1 Tax=Candida viswanathii TaxID=5486 RepID=A0A367Y1E4_9ASCO|nr:hypothetical protein Cantr_07322 [Candida viswanathii]